MLNYDEDIVCITTDGASVIQKKGQLSNCDQQFWIVHEIQLGVQDVLYKKPPTSAMMKIAVKATMTMTKIRPLTITHT